MHVVAAPEAKVTTHSGSATKLFALHQYELRPTELAVLYAFCNYLNNKNRAWPSMARVAWDAGLTKRGAQKVVESLRAGQVLRVIEGAKGGRGHTPVYELHLESLTRKQPFKGERGSSFTGTKGRTKRQLKGEQNDTQRANVVHPNLKTELKDLELKPENQKTSTPIASAPLASLGFSKSKQSSSVEDCSSVESDRSLLSPTKKPSAPSAKEQAKRARYENNFHAIRHLFDWFVKEAGKNPKRYTLTKARLAMARARAKDAWKMASKVGIEPKEHRHGATTLMRQALLSVIDDPYLKENGFVHWELAFRSLDDFQKRIDKHDALIEKQEAEEEAERYDLRPMMARY